MSEAEFYLTLGKVMIAAAWADGDVSHEELNCLKDLLFRLPGLTGREWAMLEMYVESPVGAAERQRLVEQLQAALRSDHDRRLALQTLDELVAADGEVSEQEREIVAEMQSQIESANVGLIGQLGRVLQGAIQRREQALADAPNREQHFEDYIKNKVYYGLQRRTERGEVQLDLPEERLRMLCLAGGLMARVAQVDLKVTDEELAFIGNALQGEWDLASEEAAFVADVAVSEIGPDMDYYRLTRQFFNSTDREQRSHFLNLLFAVAAADGAVSLQETEEIRTIANTLRLTHHEFIEAKLRVKD
jgi:uncharacterized tellurite resistance protein B-like protein